MDAVEIDTVEEPQNDEDAIDSTVPEVCRVCLLGNLMMRDIFVENEVVSLSTKAMSFANVRIVPGDGLPGQVCCDCADKLDSAYEFKLQVEQADNVLRQRFDALNIKEELFFNEVEVHLERENANDVHNLDVDAHYQATVDSLNAAAGDDEKPGLLKDHLALLEVQKITEQECAAVTEHKHHVEIADESNVVGILESGELHSQYLHENESNTEEMPDCVVYRQTVKEEDTHVMEGIPIDEHNYIMQQGYTLTRVEDDDEEEEEEEQEVDDIDAQDDCIDSGAHESAEYLTLMDEEINAKDDTNTVEALDSIQTEEEHEPENENFDISPSETRRSKRKLIKRLRTTDEESYFENLNLSSRLKKSQEKSEKVFFLCYLCDKQFVSKEILKEHMHSHEEVRRTLSLKKTEKLEKRQSPTKSGVVGISLSSSVATSSGKKLNTCPYCGKEYLYVISFNKHLKQHEGNKDISSFEESIQCGGGGGDDDNDDDEEDQDNTDNGEVDDNSSDFAGYEENETSEIIGRIERSNEDDESIEIGPESKKRRRSGRSKVFYSCDKCSHKFTTKRAFFEHSVEHNTSFKCNTCEQEFDELEKLRRHRSEHVVEGVLSEQDLEEHIYEREFVTEAPDDGVEIYGGDEEQEMHLETVGQEEVESLVEDENDSSWRLEVEPEDYESTERKITVDEIEENWPEVKDLKCPNCPMTYTHKKSLARHLESHEGTTYSCKICKQKFTRKDYLQRHVEQHGKTKSFKCTECNKIFGNELTLRNHLIATSHKTIVHGEAYDPNKRLKRVAAKAAQKIIDKIKTEDGLEEYGEEEDATDARNSKGNVRWARNHEKVHPTASARKAQHRNRRGSNFECETCGRKCSSKQSLMKHMEQHHVKDEKIELTIKTEKGKRNSTLELADRSTYGAQKMIVSKEERMEEAEEGDDDNNSDFESGLDWPMDSHECPTCKKKYSTKKSLLRHQLLHEEPNFECDICNVKFYRKDKLKSHYDKCSEKNPDQVRKCNICGDSFENNEMLKEHRGKHVDEGILTEDDLREIEPDERNEGGKTARKRRTDIVGLECTECNKRYTSRKGLLRHIQVHEGKKYLCDICPKKFYRREHLKIHVAKHNMIKPYKCSRCTKRFIKEDQLANHLSKHDRTFKRTKETDSSKRFLCEICSKSFTQSTTLIAHLRAHNGIKPYVCEVCARPFTTNAYLKMHMRTHTQERPYSCQYCTRAFARADTLANHLTSHTGEAKYHCKYCPKNFRRLKSLKEHVFIHTGQRPYSCPTCDRRFNNNGSRYAHSKRCKQNLLQNQNRAQTVTQTIVQSGPPPIRIHQITGDHGGQMQVLKTQNIKTITISSPGDQGTTTQVMQHQELLMPLILPLTVTLTDVDEEVILPEGTKIFTTA